MGDATEPHWAAEWYGPCQKCGTSHDGFNPETLGGRMRCLRAQALRIADGSVHMLDQIDALDRDLAARRDATLRRMDLIP